jgi:hypothetical protein
LARSAFTIDEAVLDLGVFPVGCPKGVPSAHYDVRFLVTASSEEALVISDESLDLRWWPLASLPRRSDGDLLRMAALSQERLRAQAP